MSDDGDVESFPLVWPIGRPRTHDRKHARFYHGKNQVPLYEGMRRLREELRRLGATDVVVSSNVRPRAYDLPMAKAADPTDPGAAVYFRHDGDPHCLSCDKWTRLGDNLAAIAAHVEAIRGQARWGVGDVRQALAGYKALPAMGEAAPWWRVLAFEQPPRDRAVVEAKYYELIDKHHPDRVGDAHANIAADITAAWRAAKKYYAQESR